MQSKLKIANIEQSIHLGLGDEERATKQSIFVNIILIYTANPLACTTDHIEQTIDYTKIAELVEKVCQKKPYKLIEHLAASIYAELKSNIDEKIAVEIIKPSPPHPLLGNGVSFTYGDELA